MCRKGLVIYYIMVSGIRSTNVLNQATTAIKQDDIKTLLKYVNNESLKEIPDTFTSTVKSSVGSAAAFEGIPLLNFLKRGKNVKNIVTSEGTSIAIKDAMKAMDGKTSEALRNIFKGTEGSLGERISNFVSTQNQVKKEYINLKDAVKSADKATKATLKGKSQEKILNTINDAVDKADYFVNPQKVDLKKAQKALDEAIEALAKNPNNKKLQHI